MTNSSNLRDERGAVLVLGIMLGVISVAAIAYLVNVGYASIWRESAQDAADAVAFESAVWEARGMNVVAAINIFIALTMAVLIAWRLAMLALGLLTVASLVLCLFPPTAEVCAAIAPRLASATARMAARDPKVSQNVFKVINVLHRGQQVVASAMPILAAAKSSVSGSERPRVTIAAGLGTHLLPVVALAKLQDAAEGGVGLTSGALTAGKPKPGAGTTPVSTTKPGTGDGNNNNNGNKKQPPQSDACPLRPADRGQPPATKPTPPPATDKKPRKQRKPRAPGELLGKPFSLPMETSDDLDVLCPRGTQMITKGTNLVLSTLMRELLGAEVDSSQAKGGSTASSPGLIETAFEKVVGLLPQSGLCGDLTTIGDDFIDDQLNAACADNPEQQKKFDVDSKKKAGESWQDVCRRETRTQLEDKQKTANANQAAAAKGRAKQEPVFAQVWGPLANGNIFAQSWSVAQVQQDHSAMDRLVGLAAAFGGGSTTTAASGESNVMLFAQAEMFYDCEGGWDDANCYPNAAWTLNWRARMRRLHSPFEIAAAGAERAASQRFQEVLNAPPLRPLIAAIPGGQLAEIFAPVAGGLVPDNLRRETEALRSEVAQRGGAAARWVVEQGLDRASFIH